MCVYVYIIFFSIVVEWFVESRCRHLDGCRGNNCRITYSLWNKAWITTIAFILDLFILHYIIILYYIVLYYIILHILRFFLPLIYKLFKGSNGRVKLERSRQWQLDNSWGKASERGLWWRWQHHPRFAFLCLYFLWRYVDVKDSWNKKVLGILFVHIVIIK